MRRSEKAGRQGRGKPDPVHQASSEAAEQARAHRTQGGIADIDEISDLAAKNLDRLVASQLVGKNRDNTGICEFGSCRGTKATDAPSSPIPLQINAEKSAVDRPWRLGLGGAWLDTQE
jgi:hypothetical protein